MEAPRQRRDESLRALGEDANQSGSPQDSPSPRLPDYGPLSTAPPDSAAGALALAGWATCGQAPTLVCASPAVKRGTARHWLGPKTRGFHTQLDEGPETP